MLFQASGICLLETVKLVDMALGRAKQVGRLPLVLA